MEQFTTFIANQWQLSLAFVAVLILIIRHETQSALHGIKLLSPSEAVQLMNREQAVVVDIRDEKAYSQGHILDAIHCESVDSLIKHAKLKKNAKSPVIINGNADNAATKFGKELKAQGLLNVYCLKGGIQSWQSANLPLINKG